MKVYGIETSDLTLVEKAGMNRAYLILRTKQGEVGDLHEYDKLAWWTAYCKLRNAANYLNEILAAADSDKAATL
jgi:hypothetical protein